MYLHNFNLFSSQLIQATIELVEIVREAKINSSHTIKISNDTLRFIKVDTTFCIASSTLEELSQSFATSVFKNISLINPPLSISIEALLIVNGFTDKNNLGQFLSRYSKEYNIPKHDIQALITRSIQHISNYYDTNPTASSHLHSAVTHHVIMHHVQETHDLPSRQSDTQRNIGNLFVVHEEEEEEQERDDEEDGVSLTIQQRLEQISILVSIWELQLSFPIEILCEFFPKLEVGSILEGLDKSQQEMIEGCNWSREDIESAQESRATSVMQSEKDKEGLISYNYI